jgi:serine/threonine protein kinase
MDKEAAMLAALDHDNVVKMFGVCKAAETQSLYLVLELMNMGDLKTYVKQRQPQCDNYSQFPPALLNTELINIAQQVG